MPLKNPGKENVISRALLGQNWKFEFQKSKFDIQESDIRVVALRANCDVHGIISHNVERANSAKLGIKT